MRLRRWSVILIFSLHTYTFVSGQDTIAVLDPGKGFATRDYTISSYDPHTSTFRLSFQTGDDFTRLLLDTNFRVLKSYSYQSATTTFTPKKFGRTTFWGAVTLASGVYEIFAKETTISIVKPDFANDRDSLQCSFDLRVIDKDERLLAAYPVNASIQLLTIGYKNNVLKTYNWSPGLSEPAIYTFPLPESNVDRSLYKEFPKDTRVNYKKQLVNIGVQPLRQETLMGSYGSQLYYTDSTVHILMWVPYRLGMFVIKLDLKNNSLSSRNYQVNDLRVQAGTNNYKIKSPDAFIYDSLLVIKNVSPISYEYLFYNVHSGNLIRKYEATESTIETVVNSPIRQKGTWASKKEEKEFDKEKTYLKQGIGFIIPSSVSKDSITLTSIRLVATTGVGGTLLDLLVPLPFEIALAVPQYITVMMPPLGKSRNKIIYFHSKFEISDLEASPGKKVRTMFDDIVDDYNSETLFDDMCFLVRKERKLLLGSYSKKDNKIQVIQYREKQ
ncbi:MAG: hypothetical protein ACT4OJ_02570 [Bacteroidota bacterium]